MESSRLERIFLASAARPLPFLAILFLSLAVALAGVPRVTLDTSQESLLDPKSADYRAYEEFAEEFGAGFVAIILLEADEVFTPRRLKAIADITDRLRLSEMTIDVQSLATAFNIESGAGLIGYVPLAASPPDSDAQASRMRRRAMENPLIADALVSRRGDTAAIVASLDAAWTGADARAARDMVERAIAPDAGAFSRAYHIGPARFITDTEAAIGRDLGAIGAASGLLMLAILFISMRSAAAVALPTAIGVVSLVWTFGLMGWTGLPITLLSTALPALVFVVGSAEATYLLAAYRRASLEGAGAASRMDALRKTAREAGLACVLTSATTIAGFAVGGIMSIDLVRVSAAAMSAGLALSFAATLLILPMALAHSPLGRVDRTTDVARAGPLARGFARRIVATPKRAAHVFIFASSAAILGCLWIAINLRPSADPLALLNKKHPLVETVARVQERLGGTQTAFLSIAGEDGRNFRQLDPVRRLHAAEAAVRKMPEFDAAYSLADHLYYARSVAAADPDSPYAHEELSQSDLDDFIFLFPREATKRFVSDDFARAVIAIRHNIFDSATLEDAIRKAEGEARRIFGQGFKIVATGKSVILNRAADRLVTNLLMSFLLLILVVAVMIGAAFRSWRAGLLCVLPNVLPAAAVFAAMAAFNIPLNAGTALAAVVALGIAVDDTIHLFNKFRLSLPTCADADEALRDTIETQLQPVCATSFSLAGGFAVLTVSEFAAVGQFGMLCAFAILVALPCDLFFTSALLRAFGAASFRAPAPRAAAVSEPAAL